MKKVLSLLLAVAMLLSVSLCFAGCENEDIRGTFATDPTTPTDNQTPNGDDPVTGQTPEFSMGTVTGRNYKNEFLGISCTLPAEWEIFTDAQILEMNNITSGYLDEDTKELLKNANIVYDMYAQYLVDGSSININMEKLNALQLINLNIKQVLESQIPTIKSSYENMGYTDVNVVYQKLTVDSKEFDSIRVTAKIQGYDFTLIVFSFLKGNYLANVSVGSLNTASIDAILGSITIQ